MLAPEPAASTRPLTPLPAFVPSSSINGVPEYPGWLVPSIVIGAVRLGRADSRAIVCTPEPEMLKSIMFAAGLTILAGFELVLKLAQPIAARSVPRSLESAVLVTMYEELASYAPISSVDPAFSPADPRTAPRWSVVGMVKPAMELLPASIAGLPGSRAMVLVGPP